MVAFQLGCPVLLLCVLLLLCRLPQPSECFSTVAAAMRSPIIVPTTASTSYKHSVDTTTRFTALAADISNNDYDEPSEHHENNNNNNNNKLPMLLDVGTKGGALFLSFGLFCAPLALYQLVTQVGGVDQERAGVAIGVGFTSVLTLGWVSTLLTRVINKDMTYVCFLIKK